jgi:uncharacterized UPF0160 family protein
MFVREIKRANDRAVSAKIVKGIYEKTDDKRLVIMDEHYSWRKTIKNYPEPLFVVLPKTDGTWSVDTIVVTGEKFKRRLYFPMSWGGKRDEELEKVTGVKGSIFCHNDRFICITKTKDGAIKLAQLALEDSLKQN